MTAHEYIEYIKREFEGGKLFVEIRAEKPRKLYRQIAYKTYACKLHWGFQVMDDSVIIRPCIRTRHKQLKPKQPTLFAPASPGTGVYCKTCGKELRTYEIKFSECLSHVQARQIAWHSEPVAARGGRMTT